MKSDVGQFACPINKKNKIPQLAKKQFANKKIYLAMMLACFGNKTLADEVGAEAAIHQEDKPSLNINVHEVEVHADVIKPKDGYQATKTRVGKTLQDPHDIPQAVTTVTNQLMKDQQVGSLREALRNVSGLTFNAAEGGRSGDNFMLRGFYTFGDTYLDNMRDTAQYNRETFNLEQVDVLRGSAAMLFGRGQAGGVINQVSKMATLEDENVITGSLGEYGYHQFTGDFEKQLAETVAIRVNVMDREEETYRTNPANGDHPELDRQGLAVSFGAGIGTDNEFFLNHSLTQTRDVPDYGVSFFNKRPVDRTVSNGTIDDRTFFGGDKTFDDSDTRMTTAIFTHKFSPNTQLRTQLRSADYERAYWAKTPSNLVLPTATLANRPAGCTLPATQNCSGNATRKSDYETLNFQSDFSTKFDLGGMKHEVLAGFEILDEDSFRHALRNIGTAADPVYRQSQLEIRNPALNRAYNEFDGLSKAYYVQDTLEFIPHWKATMGWRRDHMNADYTSSVGTDGFRDRDTQAKVNFKEDSYRAGLSWQPTDAVHYYVSFTDSFSPTADLYQLTTTKPQPAESSETIELGSKWLFFDGDLSLRTSLYRATKFWERNTDLEATAAILTKKRRTDGFEIEAAGRLTDNWQIFGGISLMDAEILEVAENINATTGAIQVADARFKGQRPRNTPNATANFWTTYQFLGNWKAGLGFEAKGDRYGYNPQQLVAQTSAAGGVFSDGTFKPNTLPGYTRWDAMLTYDQPKWAMRLNVKNLFNKIYYDALYDNGGFSVPGNKRQAILTTELKF